MKNENDGVRVRGSKEFKLKEKEGRRFTVIHLKDFGFIPEVLIFERTRGSWFRVNAVLTPDEIKKEDKFLKKKPKKDKND